jgi:hypothetical protein
MKKKTLKLITSIFSVQDFIADALEEEHGKGLIVELSESEEYNVTGAEIYVLAEETDEQYKERLEYEKEREIEHLKARAAQLLKEEQCAKNSIQRSGTNEIVAKHQYEKSIENAKKEKESAENRLKELRDEMEKINKVLSKESAAK